jgi:hypothetical protein
VSNRDDGDAQRLVSAYSVRWRIEVFFKECKSELGLGNDRVRDFKEVEGGAQVCCIGFVYPEW